MAYWRLNKPQRKPKMKTLISVFVVVVLSGCATTKPQLASEGYSKVAMNYVGSYRCGEKGYISSEIASLSMQYSVSSLNGISYDQERLKQQIQQYEQRTDWPSKEGCNQIAMMAQTQKRQIDINNQNSAANQEFMNQTLNNRPKPTYCNKIGTQLFCNTY